MENTRSSKAEVRALARCLDALESLDAPGLDALESLDAPGRERVMAYLNAAHSPQTLRSMLQNAVSEALLERERRYQDDGK